LSVQQEQDEETKALRQELGAYINKKYNSSSIKLVKMDFKSSVSGLGLEGSPYCT